MVVSPRSSIHHFLFFAPIKTFPPYRYYLRILTSIRTRHTIIHYHLLLDRLHHLTRFIHVQILLWFLSLFVLMVLAFELWLILVLVVHL
jgi:hypothetical protein